MNYTQFEKYQMYCIDYLQKFGISLREAFEIVEDAGRSHYLNIPDDYTSIADEIYEVCLEHTESYVDELREMHDLYTPTYMTMTEFSYIGWSPVFV